MEVSSRTLWIDSLKGWLMLLVILGHSIQYVFINSYDSNHVWNSIYSFHMPAFIAVSGYVAALSTHHRGGYFHLIKRKFLQLIIPYLIWDFIYLLSIKAYDVQSLVRIITNPSLWFLWVLFWISVIFLSIKEISKKYHIKEIRLNIVACVVLMLVMLLFNIRLFGFQYIAYYFTFYVIGYYINKYHFLIRKQLLPFAFAGWCVLAWFWKMHGIEIVIPSFIPQSVFDFIYRGVSAFLGIYVIFGFLPSVLSERKAWNTIIARIGTLTLGIYVVHLILVKFVAQIATSLFNVDGWMAVIITGLILIFISVPLVLLLRVNKYLSKFLLGKF